MSKSHITTNVKGDVRIFRTRVLLETETDGEIQRLCILMVLFEVPCEGKTHSGSMDLAI